MSHFITCFFEIYEDKVQVLPMLKTLFTKDSEVENLFCGASIGSEPVLQQSSLQLGFEPGQ